MNTVLQSFYERLPARPYATSNFDDGICAMPRDRAIKEKYIQFNTSKLKGWLAFDIDYAGASLAAEAANLPEPTLTIIKPENMHAHLLYRLGSPVAGGDNARSAPIDYMKAIKHAFGERLGADVGYSGFMVQNPLNNAWRVASNDVSYELSELAEYVDLTTVSKNMYMNREFNESYRNCSIFDEVRKWAYRKVYQCASHDSFHISVYSHCVALNSLFTKPLPDKELGYISKSISSYVWLRKDRGFLISADVCNRIKSACSLIALDIDPVDVCTFAQKEVAKLAGVDSRTIRRFLQTRAT